MHTVEGFIIDRNKNKLRFLYGRWNEFLCAADPEVGYCLSCLPVLHVPFLTSCLPVCLSLPFYCLCLSLLVSSCEPLCLCFPLPTS
jgi:hypothetical protein